MIPTIEEAREELGIAGQMNPGPWVEHSKNVALTAERIAAACGMDAQKAYVLGLLHDIGRRYGRSAVKHTIDGYDYMCSKGWEEAAIISLTHSNPTKNIYEDIQKMDITDEEKGKLEAFIANHEYDDYDKLIILCDSLALPDRFCILEQRFIDTSRRYGVFPFSVKRWDATFEIKEYFEQLAGKSIYEIIPEVKENLK